MKAGVKVAVMGGSGVSVGFCVLTENVWNIWNIGNLKNKPLVNQRFESEILFHLNRNTLERTGTNLFQEVPGMFRFPRAAGTGWKPSAAGSTATYTELLFRDVPVRWNIDQSAAHPEFPGLQPFSPWPVPDVPDHSRAYADFFLFRAAACTAKASLWPG
ncbi:hypothetical protein [Pseudomonas tohonis]|uniref:hypothetical protein n=1 Tax=Pseudomonas tohonis TaxID=2725477 RepID=UPI0022EFEBE4|nr:hypothetical protein [Pseudomonas tohonis]